MSRESFEGKWVGIYSDAADHAFDGSGLALANRFVNYTQGSGNDEALPMYIEPEQMQDKYPGGWRSLHDVTAALVILTDDHAGGLPGGTASFEFGRSTTAGDKVALPKFQNLAFQGQQSGGGTGGGPAQYYIANPFPPGFMGKRSDTPPNFGYTTLPTLGDRMIISCDIDTTLNNDPTTTKVSVMIQFFSAPTGIVHSTPKMGTVVSAPQYFF
jgi:hypothetical protein